jgi:hypothetical protein
VEAIIAWCGFVGAWLLVAGPVYQAAVELSDQEMAREDVERLTDHLDRSHIEGAPPRVSSWWWLFPPVLYLKHRRREATLRQLMLSQLTPEQAGIVIDYLNKSTGWLLVGAGGLLIATKETWELREHFEWPVWIFWVLCVVMAVLCLANAGRRMERSQSNVTRASGRGADGRSGR